MKNQSLMWVVVLMIAFSSCTLVLAEPMKEMGMENKRQVSSGSELRLSMRKLWEDHIAYTRNYIISSLANLEDERKIADRLLKNQDEIGEAIKPFYGEEAGNKLAELLRDHITIATDVVAAAKMGDHDQLIKNQEKWRDNAEAIASFLSGANPNLSKTDLSDMLNKHLDFTTQEVVSRLQKNWGADIEAYDNGHAHMLMFSDALSSAIAKQFPKKFKNA